MASSAQIGENPVVTGITSFLPRVQGHHRTNLALAGWIVVILAAGILPLRNFVGHSHWDYIQWTIPATLWHSGRFYFDVIANVALFFPLGLLLSRRVRTCTTWRVMMILGGGLLLSVGIESFQIFCHNRHPSPYDIFSNVTGTALGVGTAARVFSLRLMDELFPLPHSHPTGS
jgi:glycopeptide antibiotics resistance protein